MSAAGVRRGRSNLLVLAALVAGALSPAVGPPAPACAAERDTAALVVDLGAEGGVLRLCVALGDDPVSGLELIELAARQHGLEYGLGFGGQAVCRLAGVGPRGDDCFEDFPDFWGYWRADASGGWTWSSAGAGSSVVDDGDVEGWSWGPGDNGSTHPAPAPSARVRICPVAPAPAPEPDPRPPEGSSGSSSAGEPDEEDRGERAGARVGGGGGGASRPDPARPRTPSERRARASPAARRVRREARSSLSDLTVSDRPRVEGRRGPERPPAAGLAGVGAALLLAGAGALTARRRRARAS